MKKSIISVVVIITALGFFILPAYAENYSLTKSLGVGIQSHPNRIAIDPTSNFIYVSYSDATIKKFSVSGAFITQWGSNGTGDGQFKNEPGGIAVDSLGNVYVADTGNSRIQKFASNGKFLLNWYVTGEDEFATVYPTDVAVDKSNNVYVTDMQYSRVQKFTSEGKFITKWGFTANNKAFGSADGQFYSPEGIAVDNLGNVYVSDWGNNRIQKFTSDGEFTSKWGTNGTGDGQLKEPRGISVDSQNNVYVADYGNYRIQKFTSDGQFISKLDLKGFNDSFVSVFGVVVDSTGTIYVPFLNEIRAFGIVSTQALYASNPRIVGLDGKIIDPPILNGEQVQITADLKNNQVIDQPFAYLVQIQDNNGITVAKSWITGKLTAGQSLSPALPWTPKSNGTYAAQIFVWQSIDNPNALSNPLSINNIKVFLLTNTTSNGGTEPPPIQYMQVEKSGPIPTTTITVSYMKNPPKFTPAQLHDFEKYLKTIDLPEKPIPITNTTFSKAAPNTDTIADLSTTTNTDFHEKNQNQIVFVSQKSGYQPISFDTLGIQLNGSVNFDIQSHLRLEPTAAHGESTIFYSSNFFAARSLDNGTNWDFLDPAQNPLDPQHHPIFLDTFHADSDVIYDPTNKIFIWYQQGQVANGNNVFRLTYSTDAITWHSADISPSWGGSWWDYPQLALTKKYLFITTNLKFANGNYDNVILRQSLKDLADDKPFNFEKIHVSNEHTITPVQGATDTMFLASQNTNNQIKIYKWKDSDSAPSVTISRLNDPWKPLGSGTIDCTSAVNDWCNKADDRILNGWIFGNRIGFFWNAPADPPNGFSKPYVNAAVFDTTSLENIGRPYIKDDHDRVPWMYAYSSPNARGLGLIAFSGESPTANIGAENFASSPPPPWKFSKLRSSTSHVPEFGDYVRVRSFDTTGCLWMGTGYTALESSDPDPTLKPFLTIFGSNTCPKIVDEGHTCPSGQTRCSSNMCTNIQTDANNCGTCGNSCSDGYSCIAGACTLQAPVCTSGQIQCSPGVCVNPASDQNNCGACGNVCQSGQTCQTGVCKSSGCMIGNAYPYSSPEIKSIVDFRENKIMNTAAGSNFMTVFNAWYFSFSPYIADYETQHPWFQQLVKISTYPLVSAITFSEKPFSMIGGDYGVLVTGLIVSSLIGAVYFSPLVVLTKSYAKNRLNTKFVILTLSTVFGVTVLSIVVNNPEFLMVTMPLYVIVIIATSAILMAKIVYLLTERVKRKFS